MIVETFGEGEFRALGKRLAKAADGKLLRRNLTRNIQLQLSGLRKDLQASIRRVESRGVSTGGARARRAHHLSRRARERRGGYGLRATIATAIKTRVKYTGDTVGARVYVDTSALPRDQRKLPRYLDSTRGWKHPVFGHKGRWARQTGAQWWEPPIRTAGPKVRVAVLAAIDQTIREIRI